MHLKLSGKIIQANTAETLAPPGIPMDFNFGPKVPFPRFLDIGQFHSPHSVDYFISFHIVVDTRQGKSIIFQISTWEAILLLKKYLLRKIRLISVKGWKSVRIHACSIVLST